MDNNEFQRTIDRYKKELMDMALNGHPNHQKLSEETYDKFLMENPKSGKLKIQASIAQGILPIPGVSVTVKKIFSDQEKIFFNGKTDESGIIDNIVLPAPDKTLSESPSNGIPYAHYYAIVEHPDYHPLQYANVNIFDGVKSIQTVKLIPKSIT